jgi:hypothetical protein
LCAPPQVGRVGGALSVEVDDRDSAGAPPGREADAFADGGVVCQVAGGRGVQYYPQNGRRVDQPVASKLESVGPVETSRDWSSKVAFQDVLGR